MTTTAVDTAPARRRGPVQRHPVSTFIVGAILATWAVQFTFLANGWELFGALVIEIFILLGAATGVTAATEGRAGVRRLLAGALRWRFGLRHYAVALLGLPALALLFGAVTGTLRAPTGGYLREVLSYLFLTVIFGAVLGNVWEETAWAGFAQARLTARHGLLRGSLLTAIPFALIHLPLAFEADGLGGTSARDLTISWVTLFAAAPFLRYLLGATLIDTAGSLLAVGILHASFNATQQLTVLDEQWWQPYLALPVLTVLVAVSRRPRETARDAQARLDERG